jgi:hypothetical protein
MGLDHYLFSFCLICVNVVAGCSAVAIHPDMEVMRSQSSEQKKMTEQFIIKFRVPGLDPSHADFAEGLSSDARATLIYLRPVSGGAYVFSVGNISDSVSAVIQRLSVRPDILYIEQDNIVHHQ